MYLYNINNTRLKEVAQLPLALLNKTFKVKLVAQGERN